MQGYYPGRCLGTDPLSRFGGPCWHVPSYCKVKTTKQKFT